RATEVTKGAWPLGVCPWCLSFVSSVPLCVLVLYRVARGLRLQLSAGRVAAGSARRSRGGARLSGNCAAGSRRGVRSPALPQGRAGGGHWPDRGGGVDDRGGRRGRTGRKGRRGRTRNASSTIGPAYPAFPAHPARAAYLAHSAPGASRALRIRRGL